MTEQWRVRGIRGAITVEANEKEAIVDATCRLVQEMMRRNGVAIEDIASVIITATRDLDAEFPAVGARRAGLTHVPLMCAAEIDVPGAQSRCVRVLMHVNTPKGQREIEHVYLGEAAGLRPDLVRDGQAAGARRPAEAQGERS